MTRTLAAGGAALVAAGLLVGGLGAADPPSPARVPPHPLFGTADLIDGDTLDIHGTRVRLHGVDAPERDQICHDAAGAAFPCGGRASIVLDDLIARRPVGCDPVDTDRYGRTVAVCYVGDVDVGAALVRAGWAFAYRDYATTYVPQEEAAARAGDGLWGGTFQYPWVHRRERRSGRDPATPTPTPTPRAGAAASARDVATACCQTCSQGKACGDACIPKDRTCHQGPGCACDR